MKCVRTYDLLIVALESFFSFLPTAFSLTLSPIDLAWSLTKWMNYPPLQCMPRKWKKHAWYPFFPRDSFPRIHPKTRSRFHVTTIRAWNNFSKLVQNAKWAWAWTRERNPKEHFSNATYTLIHIYFFEFLKHLNDNTTLDFSDRVLLLWLIRDVQDCWGWGRHHGVPYNG